MFFFYFFFEYLVILFIELSTLNKGASILSRLCSEHLTTMILDEFKSLLVLSWILSSVEPVTHLIKKITIPLYKTSIVRTIISLTHKLCGYIPKHLKFDAQNKKIRFGCQNNYLIYIIKFKKKQKNILFNFNFSIFLKIICIFSTNYVDTIKLLYTTNF